MLSWAWSRLWLPVVAAGSNSTVVSVSLGEFATKCEGQVQLGIRFGLSGRQRCLELMHLSDSMSRCCSALM